MSKKIMIEKNCAFDIEKVTDLATYLSVAFIANIRNG